MTIKGSFVYLFVYLFFPISQSLDEGAVTKGEIINRGHQRQLFHISQGCIETI